MGNGYLNDSGCASGVMKSFETGERWWWHNTVKALLVTSVHTLKWSIVRYMNFTPIKKKKRILTNAWREEGASRLPCCPRIPRLTWEDHILEEPRPHSSQNEPIEGPVCRERKQGLTILSQPLAP